jgi:polyhydroxyalkanoate synthase subunit PhaC
MPDMPTPLRPLMLASNIGPPQARTPHLSVPADLDRMLHVWQSRFTGGRSPSTVGLAVLDWAAHAANAPFQTAELGRTALAQRRRLAHAAMGQGKAIEPQPDDRRFSHPAWQQRPYDLLTQAVLLGEEWWDSVARSPSGVGRHNERMFAFTVRQWLDLISPSNLPWLNPEVIEATCSTGGANFAAGMDNFLRDRAAVHGAAATNGFLPPRQARSFSAMR